MSNLSTYKTIDTSEQLSIEYKNLYSINGVIYYFSTSVESLPYVNKFTDSYSWAPQLKVFNNEEEINSYLLSFKNKQEIHLSTLGDNLWYGNIGHALWDGLYPLYVALIKFGYKDAPFTLLTSPWDNKKSMAYDIITKFSGSKLLEYHNLDKSKIIHFKTLVAGTGSAGNRVINKSYTLYGEKEYKALTLFKERLLKVYNIKVDKLLNKKPKVIIIKNKRFTSYEISIIQDIVDSYKDKLDIKYIDWYHDYQSFDEQLKELEDVDIHISGPGTGMMYMPLLKKGAVNINLGYMEYTQTNTARPNLFIKQLSDSDHILPGWMEQCVCAGANYVSTIYYDRFTYNNLETGELSKLLDQAISLVQTNTTLTNNHNIDALVFIEYCKRVDNGEVLAKYLTSIGFFIELFVNEHPHVIYSGLVNLDILRQVKDELEFNRSYEIKI